MRVAVTGSSGLIGSALTAALVRDGHQLTRLVRHPPSGPDEAGWDPGEGLLDREALRRVDAVVHLAGEPIPSRRWTEARKRRIRGSRVQGTRLLAEALAGLPAGPRVLACASGIHFYGDRGDEVLTEDSPPDGGFLADVVRAWEAAADPAREAGVRVVHLRTGIVLSAQGGALAKMLPLFKLGLGGRFGSGRAWWSWVSIDDVVGAYRHAIERDTLAGPANLTAPTPVRNGEFARTLGAVLGRPALLAVPKLGPRILLGETADELLFNSARVMPSRLEASGYVFQHRTLEQALRAVV